jgi:hypothetical protein
MSSTSVIAKIIIQPVDSKGELTGVGSELLLSFNFIL